MRRKWKAAVPGFVLTLLLLCGTQAYALEAEALVPIGKAVGIRLDVGGVMVAGISEVETAMGKVSPADNAGVRPGDVITEVAGRATPNAAEFISAIQKLDGSEVELAVLRGGEELRFRLTPACAQDGSYHLGLWLRDGVTGIGTVTFYDPVSGTYGALGHGINDPDSGTVLPFESGGLAESKIVNVVRGAPGTPGELCGEFAADTTFGSVNRNTDAGIFGNADFSGFGAPLPLATEREVKLGPASILSNVSDGKVEQFGVEISRIYRGRDDNRSLLLTVTDERLLNSTGGIVQGMSGSPIIQDGKLIGAVTHVLVNDPTKGYGILIENMLDTGE